MVYLISVACSALVFTESESQRHALMKAVLMMLCHQIHNQIVVLNYMHRSAGLLWLLNQSAGGVNSPMSLSLAANKFPSPVGWSM